MSDYSDKLREKAEIILNKDDTWNSIENISDAKELFHELKVHQIELEMQNQELRDTQDELITSRDKYTNLYDYAPVGYFTIDHNTNIVDVNLTGSDQVGIERSRAIDTRFTRYIDPEYQDQFYFHVQGIYNHNLNENNIIKIRPLNADPFFAQIQSMPASDIDIHKEGGRLIRIAVMNITKIIEKEHSLQTLLNEKDMLLKEIHHRVKNNLQIVNSLLNLHMKSVPDSQLQSMLMNCQQRIRSISLVHEKLYLSSDLTTIDISEYIKTLVDEILKNLKSTSRVNKTIEVDEINIDIDTAITIGLIINELIINSIKHASNEDDTLHIFLTLYWKDANLIELKVKDNGAGFNDNFDIHNQEGLGFQLVTILIDKLKGELNYGNDNGAKFIITFPLEIH